MVELRIFDGGNKIWYLNNQHHRSNGPTVVWTDGVLHWYWHDQEVTEYEHMILAGQERANG